VWVSQERGYIITRMKRQMGFKLTRSLFTNFGTIVPNIPHTRLYLIFLLVFRIFLIVRMLYVMCVVKQNKLVYLFLVSENNAINCFDLIHYDILGAYHMRACCGAQYFLSIVDDASRGV